MTRESQWIEIANEFALVRVRRVRTLNGERLEIEAPKVGRAVRLDPIQLESLTYQTPESLSKLVAISTQAIGDSASVAETTPE